MSITPGSNIKLEIAKLPSNAAARKTLTRLCRRDAGVQRTQRHQQRKRPSLEFWNRGNKQWHHQMKTIPPVTLHVGAAYQMRATLDVIRDIASIEKWVKVSAV